MFVKKYLYAFLTIVFISLSLVGTLYLVQRNQDIRDHAAGENQLVCMPIDDSGNITAEKYRYNRIKVTNNTGGNVIIWIQENLCDYKGTMPSAGYRCDNYHRRYNDTVGPGQSKIYSMDVPCGKIGQLDIAQDDAQMGTYVPDCYNTTDQQIWSGGISFTIKADTRTNCCPQVNLSVLPSQVSPGGKVTFDASSSQPLVCVEMQSVNGTTGSLSPTRIEGGHWKWDATAISTPGKYTVTFRGNTKDSGVGDCPSRAIGDWCPAQATFDIQPATTNTPTPTATKTPTPTATKTPTPTATKTPTPTATRVPTNTPSPTATNTPPPGATLTSTPIATNTLTPTATNTPAPTNTPPPGATLTPTPLATNTPVPTPVIAESTPVPPTGTPVYVAQVPSPTTVILPQAGVNFPLQLLAVVGTIITLFGFLILL